MGAAERIAKNKYPEQVREELKKKVKRTEAWFLDLDDNLAPSPAKKIVKKAIGTKYYSPDYLKWLAETGWASWKKGKEAETEGWRDYVERFLDEGARKEVKEMFKPEEVEKSFYPGVEEWGRLISRKAEVYLISRNIEEVVEAYATALGRRGISLQGIFPEAYKKEEAIKQFIEQQPKLRLYGIDGDSQEEGKMIEVLKGKIVLGIYSMGYPTEGIDERFDFGVSREDRSGLVEITERD